MKYFIHFLIIISTVQFLTAQSFLQPTTEVGENINTTQSESISTNTSTMFQYLRVEEKENSIYIQWQTYNELNVSHYVVERSTNGQYFEEIGIVKYTPFQTQSRRINTYSFSDPALVHSPNVYYRITSIGIGGIEIPSEIQKINLEITEIGIKAYPNPLAQGSSLHIETSGKIKQVTLFDLLGRNVYSKTYTQPAVHSSNLNINNPGHYILKIVDRSHNIHTQLIDVK